MRKATIGYLLSASVGCGLLLCGLTGCTSTTVTTPAFTVKRTSFLQRLEMADVSLSTNGTASMKGYKTDGGNEAAAAIVGAAVGAAVSAAK